MINAPLDISSGLPELLSAAGLLSSYAELVKRRYVTPGGYPSDLHPVEMAYRMAASARRQGERHVIAEETIAYGCQRYWMGRDLLQAIWDTELPAHLRFSDIPLPYPACMIILPQGMVRSEDGMDATCILINRLNQPAFARYCANPDETSGGIVTTTIWTSQRHLDLSIGLLRDGISVAQLLEPPTVPDPTAPPIDARFRATRVAIASAFLLVARPVYIEEPTFTKHGKGTERGERREFWSPRWVGRTYRYVHRPPGDGTHASPTAHWRRGHWRQQPVGPRTAQDRRIIWIEPTFVEPEMSQPESPCS